MTFKLIGLKETRNPQGVRFALLLKFLSVKEQLRHGFSYTSLGSSHHAASLRVGSRRRITRPCQ